ncbi:hypothetical protein RRG08_008857 [Elysia crispata]|uniref:Uncharacterized protein n=1 Tax=Elysia crispata TaxID=231223 RepID=A0AAE1A9L2_9GAST|nr:hypothetical protein RRG08_008857 [Elysia crispata]
MVNVGSGRDKVRSKSNEKQSLILIPACLTSFFVARAVILIARLIKVKGQEGLISGTVCWWLSWHESCDLSQPCLAFTKLRKSFNGLHQPPWARSSSAIIDYITLGQFVVSQECGPATIIRLSSCPCFEIRLFFISEDPSDCSRLYYTVYPVDLAELMMLEEFSTPHYLQSLPWRKLAAFFRSICQADDDGGGVNTRTSLCFPSRLSCLRPSGRVACTARTSQIFPRLGN